MSNILVSSKAFYNRSQHQIFLKEFSLPEIRAYLGIERPYRELLTAKLALGGIPEYLKLLKKEPSILLGICQNSFIAQSPLSIEYEKIFVSSLSNNPQFESIIRFLSQRPYATRMEIEKHLKTSSGGSITKLLRELEACTFIEKYTPFHLKENSTVVRYCVCDNYLQFYFRFIEPIIKDIEMGVYHRSPSSALSVMQFDQWLGYAFERFCRRHHHIIAQVLGFHAIEYRSGAFFSRKDKIREKGFQVDLVFERKDRVLTICEIKYKSAPIGTDIIETFDRNLELLRKHYPRSQSYSIQRVLICAPNPSEALKSANYFDQIITADTFFEERLW